ncbi:response regulator transcription factor [Paenibacillus paeoniae]|uniref:Response regulator n=1 Tax=Paenibacillus paeoniae TaxID=2292705 RepID=A0A371PH96_9BACL|nr:response regulator [Paenibacillus paeoniae]REK74908.1 response regulator [Paenibacillus paeoniae]
MHILIVDDERTIREGLKRTIGSVFQDVNVSTAASADDALQLLLREHIHVVFLDIMMPGMNGLELLAEARHTHKGIKWIVVSAYSEFAYAQEALRLGAKDYILKPFGRDQVVQSVTTLLEEWRLEKAKPTGRGLLEQNLNYLREAVFRRWVQGLDIGNFDLRSIREEHELFHLLAIKLNSNPELTLGNFIVENVTAELIERHGKGFLVNLDGDFLVGVITLAGDMRGEEFKQEAVKQLDRCLQVPYQFYMSELLLDFYSIPEEIRKFHKTDKEAEADEDHVPAGKSDVIDIAIQYMKSNFQENLSLEIVSSVVYLNPVYFSKLFKQKTGTGYKEYVTKLRMERSEELLSDPELSITRIAELVGYPDVRHFTQVFRKHYDCTPSHFRAEKSNI